MRRSYLPLSECAVEYARDFIGLEEHGSNLGPGVEWFQRLGRIRAGQPWCAAFVNGVAEIACAVKDVTGPLEAVPLQGYVQSYYDYGSSEGWLVDEPDVGDLFLVWHESKERYAHIGFVQIALPGYIKTVEGNSNDDGSREGREVAENWRQIKPGIVFLRWTA